MTFYFQFLLAINDMWVISLFLFYTMYADPIFARCFGTIIDIDYQLKLISQ